MAQTGTEDAEPGETLAIAPGPQYDAGWLHRLFFGSHYRDLWTTPLEAHGPRPGPASPADSRPRQRGGGEQTKSLRFEGARREGVPVPVDRQGSGEDTAAGAANDRRGRHRARPDQRRASRRSGDRPPATRRSGDPAPGAAGLHSPQGPSPPGPVREGVRWTARHDRRAAQRRGGRGVRRRDGGHQHDQAPEGGGRQPQRPGGCHSVPHRAAGGRVHRRLGPARRTSGAGPASATTRPHRWVPIPRDRDQAFALYDGLLLVVARASAPQLVKFGPKYAGMLGQTWNGRDLDRRFLVELEREDWDSVATALQSRLTDSVIEAAAARLPRELHPARFGAAGQCPQGPARRAARGRRQVLPPPGRRGGCARHRSRRDRDVNRVNDRFTEIVPGRRGPERQAGRAVLQPPVRPRRDQGGSAPAVRRRRSDAGAGRGRRRACGSGSCRGRAPTWWWIRPAAAASSSTPKSRTTRSSPAAMWTLIASATRRPTRRRATGATAGFRVTWLAAGPDIGIFGGTGRLPHPLRLPPGSVRGALPPARRLGHRRQHRASRLQRHLDSRELAGPRPAVRPGLGHRGAAVPRLRQRSAARRGTTSSSGWSRWTSRWRRRSACRWDAPSSPPDRCSATRTPISTKIAFSRPDQYGAGNVRRCSGWPVELSYDGLDQPRRITRAGLRRSEGRGIRRRWTSRTPSAKCTPT